MVAETLAIPNHRLTTLVLWHLVSLDAPTVATLWTIFAAHALHRTLPQTLPPAMFLCIWLIYAADRLLDTRNRTHTLEPRHHFHHAHRTPFAVAILMVGFALAVLVPRLPSSFIHRYLFLAALLLAWFALIHLTRLALPKEFVPGLFFAGAVFIPIPHALVPAILFAALCTLNCLYIHAWEHPRASRVAHPHDGSIVVRVGLDRRPTAPARRPTAPARRPTAPARRPTAPARRPTAPARRPTAPARRPTAPARRPTAPARRPTAPDHIDDDATPATRLALRHLPQLAFTLALLPLARPSPIAIATSLSALALLALNYYRYNLSPTTLRAAADLALLTPLLILPFLP